MEKQVLIILFCFFATTTGQTVDKDYFHNDLAKDCRPSDRNLDLLFVLDGSGSVKGNTFTTQMSMVRKIADLVEIGEDKTMISLMQYSGWSRMEFDFKDNLNASSLRKALKHVRHLSGTTRTGKALNKALDAFRSKARMRDHDVAKVVVVVSDGHSIDDPVPAAEKLRRAGIKVLVIGIGNYVNMHELELMAGDKNLAFDAAHIDKFVTRFKQIAVGEYCEYKKKPRGAEIVCGKDAVEVAIETTKPFHGHLYVPGHFSDKKCNAEATPIDNKLVSLKIPLMGCGVQKQFLFNPSGLLFETSVMMKFHPEYSTNFDRVFGIRCFYPDMRFNGTSKEELEDGVKISAQHDHHRFGNSIGDALVSRASVPNMQMPCTYKLTKKTGDGCVLEDSRVGDMLIHRWECDGGVFGDDYGMLVHTCYFTDAANRKKLIIDEHGCSTDEFIMADPIYTKDLYVMAPGVALKYADNPSVQFQCSLTFCDKKAGKCQLPPKCDRGEELAQNRTKRQTVFQSMPQHMIERLFQLRNDMMKNTAGISAVRPLTGGAVRTRLFTKAAPIEFTTTNDSETEASTSRPGKPKFRTLRPVTRNRSTKTTTTRTVTPVRPRTIIPAGLPPDVLRRIANARKSTTTDTTTTENTTAQPTSHSTTSQTSESTPSTQQTSTQTSLNSTEITDTTTNATAKAAILPAASGRPQHPRLSKQYSARTTSTITTTTTTKTATTTATSTDQPTTTTATSTDQPTTTTATSTDQPTTTTATSTDQPTTTTATSTDQPTKVSSVTTTTSPKAITTTTEEANSTTEPQKKSTIETAFALDNDREETKSIIVQINPTTEKTKVPDKVDIRGLARSIVESLQLMKMDLASQIITVRDLEDIRSQGKSPVNWCPSPDI